MTEATGRILNILGNVDTKIQKHTGKTRQCLGDPPHEGTLIGSVAPVWHHSVPMCITMNIVTWLNV